MLDSLGVEWKLSDIVIHTVKGDPTTGHILDLGKADNDDVLIKLPGRKAEWVETKDLVKYEDRSGDDNECI